MSRGFIPPHGGYELTNVAWASIGELHEDNKDFLRLRGLPIWAKDAPRMQAFRALGTDQATYETNRTQGTYGRGTGGTYVAYVPFVPCISCASTGGRAHV